MSACGYRVHTEATSAATGTALVAATARSVLGVKAHANSGLQIKSFGLQFDGITSSALQIFCEVCYATFATKSPGTNSTSVTPKQEYGRVLAAGFTAARDWASANEPTVLTSLSQFLVPPDKGSWNWQFPLGQEPDCALAEGFVIRLTAPAAVNVIANMLVERI